MKFDNHIQEILDDIQPAVAAIKGQSANSLELTIKQNVRNVEETLKEQVTSKPKLSHTEPFMTPINWKDSGKTKHKQTYVVCEKDRDLRFTTQLDIVKNNPCRSVNIKSGHFLFLSQPKQLAKILTELN